MEPQYIRIRGARTHNLKNISVDLPRNKLIVFTGLSGSGKSSLAFDTLYAEGQRRYVESLSTYARQFLGRMDKPAVDLLEGLSPAVAIEQKTTGKNPRSTVGTVTEIYDHLRLLFARVGQRHCPQCGKPIEAQTKEEIVATLLARPEGEKVILLAPLVSRRKGSFEQLFNKLRKQGFVRVRLDGEIRNLAEEITPAKNLFHTIEVVVDRLVLKAAGKRRLEESIATVLELAEGTMLGVFPDSGEERFYSETAACRDCEVSVPELSTQLFSFNNPRGACRHCDGLGVTQDLDPNLIVPDPSLSLAAGAIAPWNSKKLFFLPKKYFSEAASRYNFDLETPFQDLADHIQNIILHGDTRDKKDCAKRRTAARARFEGVMPRLQRLFLETDSAKVREEIGRFMREHTCPACEGARLRPEARAARVGPWSITGLTRLPIEKLLIELHGLEFKEKLQPITTPILKEIFDRLSFLQGVGLGYLALERKTATLSGGEAQRIRLASQIGSRLAGVMYILDEPSIGLHQRDNDKLIKTLENLRDLGNTVIVVEHDTDTIMAADHVLDMGPGPGAHGGEVVYSGPVAGLLTTENSLTGNYLSGKTIIEIPPERAIAAIDKAPAITVRDAKTNNLQGITVAFPVGMMTCVTGVSGSGKSSLVMETLLRETRAHFHNKNADSGKLSGLEYIDKVIEIDQSPIGRTPRSNPATYTGVLTPIRELLAGLPEARARGYKAKRFSFNLKGGRCDACDGDGVLKIAMHFLPDVYVTCDACQGKRYNAETLEIHYRDRNIADILAMTVEEALYFFKNIPMIKNRLQTLFDVGLGYITLGQSATTLSGGEAQRIKLARELSKRATGKTLYILDEPTTGLHPADIKHLLHILNTLTLRGNTVIVIEHNLDVIKCADYIIDIGPEGGERGGRVVACGMPREVAQHGDSHTGKFLRRIMKNI